MQEENITIRTKIENRNKQLKKKLRGYVCVEYTKSGNKKPTKLPDFPSTTPAALIELYSEYEELDYSSTMGRFCIPVFRSKQLSGYHLNKVKETHSEAFANSLYYLCSHRQVLYSEEDYTLYFYDDAVTHSLLPLNLDIESYLDWLVFFLGVYNFEYLFLENTAPYTEILKDINQQLNTSFYNTDLIPSWFKQPLPAAITIHSDLVVGDRVKELRSELSGTIQALKKTKVLVDFDPGGTGSQLLRMLVKANDNIYEDLIHGRKELLQLTALEYKILVEANFPRHEYRVVEDYRHLGDVYKVTKLYTNIPITPLFETSLLALEALQEFAVEATKKHPNSNNLRVEFEYTMHFVWLGMYLTCYYHLKQHKNKNLTEALGLPLAQKLEAHIAYHETENTYLYEHSLLPYFKKALNTFLITDFDYLELEEVPSYILNY